MFMFSLLTQCKKDSISDSISQDSSHISLQKPKRCNAENRMQELYGKHPQYQNEIEKGRSFVHEDEYKASIRSAQETLVIPVHVIIVHRSGQSIGQGANIPNHRISDQISRLNMDFRRNNPDASKTPGIFSTADSGIEFCLANHDPQGNATQGITRFAFNGNFDSNEEEIKSATSWDPERFLNIWVAEDIDGLGYAYLPSPQSLPEESLDGVVVLTSVFGDGPQLESPYDLGRTMTHEVGHYLGLDHIWGDGCRIDDGIEDTPSQRDANEGCPVHPSPSCNNQGDMFMNYMDYADDQCMFAFTVGTSYLYEIYSQYVEEEIGE